MAVLGDDEGEEEWHDPPEQWDDTLIDWDGMYAEEAEAFYEDYAAAAAAGPSGPCPTRAGMTQWYKDMSMQPLYSVPGYRSDVMSYEAWILLYQCKKDFGVSDTGFNEFLR